MSDSASSSALTGEVPSQKRIIPSLDKGVRFVDKTCTDHPLRKIVIRPEFTQNLFILQLR
jgi:hypothetical protein